MKEEESTRVTFTLPKEHHELLKAEAKAKKVSLAWVVREAVEKYVQDSVPLLYQDRDR